MFKKNKSIDSIRFAWLLRSDIRAERPTATIPDEFRLWWVTAGRDEYPMIADAKSFEELELFSPLADYPNYGKFGMTRLLQYLISTREDLQRAFDISTEQGLWHAIAWLYVHGLREYELTDQVDSSTNAALDETPPFFVTLEDDNDIKKININWLMFFVWRCDTDLQAKYDLQLSRDRFSYLTWFFCEGVPCLNLSSLISSRWRSWLQASFSNANVPGVVLPRIVLMVWLYRSDLQSAFDICSTEGWVGLAQWAKNAWRTEPGMNWLISGKVETASSLIQPVARQRPFGLNLIGFAFGELGIGEDIRMAVAACEASGIPFKVVNINPGSQLRQADRLLEKHIGEGEHDAPYAFNLFCLTGFDTARVYLECGRSFFVGRYNIGWWPWELPIWPKDWQVAFDLVDEVWAATEFTQHMYAQAQALCPVTLMPMAVSVVRALPITRQKLGLPESKFLFLYVFDFNSYLDRKNPFGVVKAFRFAFPAGDDNVGLVLKTMNSNSENPVWRQFLKECSKDKRIVILEETLDRGEVLGLINACDAYISLHRSEGFGRTLAEAMLFGKPVLGTNFSGNMDFLQPEFGFPVKWRRRPVKPGEYPFVTESDHAWWAEPIITDAAIQMQRAKAATRNKRFAIKVRHFAERQFAPERIGELMKQRLSSIDLAGLGGAC